MVLQESEENKGGAFSMNALPAAAREVRIPPREVNDPTLIMSLGCCGCQLMYTEVALPRVPSEGNPNENLKASRDHHLYICILSW